MAASVATSLESDQPLIFEAGTGVGKSLAYLIPGIITHSNSKRPFIVSSQTISLQEQILEKDLKICRNLFTKVSELRRYVGFKTALMLGKGNYCCSTRLNNALKDAQSTKQTEMFKSDECADLGRIATWSAVAKSGVVQELVPPPLPEVWDAINADSSTCSRKNCDSSTCFYQRARKQLLSANCVIVNHSLLFSLINAGMRPERSQGILLADDFVVLDEAHRIPAIATDHIGTHVSSIAMDRALKRIYNPRTNRGILRRHGQAWDQDAVANALDATHEFFNYLADTFLAKKPIQRIYKPEFCDNIWQAHSKEVIERLGALIQKSDDERTQDELGPPSAYHWLPDAINGFVTFAEEDFVHWLERGGKKGQIVTLRSAPLNVSHYLRKYLFQRSTAAVLTSATLSDGKTMDAFQEAVGGQAAEKEIVYSPFNYKDNCRIYIAIDAPQPEPGQGRLDLDYLANMICWCSRHVEGVHLFSSQVTLTCAKCASAPKVF